MRAAFLSVRPRGQAVLIGIPRADAELRVPARLIPRGERRVIGALYGSARPERDFGLHTTPVDEWIRTTVEWYRAHNQWWEPLKGVAPVKETSAWQRV